MFDLFQIKGFKSRDDVLNTFFLTRSALLRAGLRRSVLISSRLTRHFSSARATRLRDVPGYYMPSPAGTGL
jgi:hypothetical protein